VPVRCAIRWTAYVGLQEAVVSELVVTNLDADQKRSAGKRKLPYKRVRTADGKIEALSRVDFAGPDVASQFSKAFQRAVNKARRENKKLIGTADVEPKRG
jgi:hypothetical protein